MGLFVQEISGILSNIIEKHWSLSQLYIVGIHCEYHGFTNLAIYPEVENQQWRDAGKSPNHETMCWENHLQEIVPSKRVQFHYLLVIEQFANWKQWPRKK